MGTFYHDPRWIREVQSAFGYRVHWLLAERGGAPSGGLALAEVPSLLGRRRLVSFPFSFVAGPMAEDEATDAALAEAARSLAADRGIARVEIRRPATAAPSPPGFVRSARYTTFRISTREGAAAVWSRLHDTSTRQRIRKGERAGTTAEMTDAEADWMAFIRMVEDTQRGHGVPAPPRRFFLDSCRRLQRAGILDLWVARVPAGVVAAAFVVLKGPREWVYGFSSADPAWVREFRATHVLLWAAIRRAAEAGVIFDLGRTAAEQVTLAEFKQRWGADPATLAYDYWPGAAGLHEARRDTGPLAWAARLWSLLPAPVARAGSVFYRYLG
jgi:hypothetical protein